MPAFTRRILLIQELLLVIVRDCSNLLQNQLCFGSPKSLGTKIRVKKVAAFWIMSHISTINMFLNNSSFSHLLVVKCAKTALTFLTLK